MYFFLLSLFLFMSLLLLNLHHPLLITITMIIQTTILSLIMGSMSMSFWMSYMMFLTFIGGMLVLFIYVASLTSNKLNFLTWNKIILLLSLIVTFFILIKIFFFYTNLEMNNLLNLTLFTNTENSLFLSNFYNKNEMYLTILLMNYLMLTLVIVTKISNLSYGPMRIKF
uniref:NADH-ubiquinone oxidoreductase chain 6 n=1 Tax=Phryganea bipunctata TaxID=1875852 RepID=A0A7D7FAU2_9NEOP|nr:NADH dehydrogenase subunit 6 [Phryganea bipunctata]QMP96681.1 NADH dehydrogenase subunit 6 [Phryganea bipunctata]